MSKKLVSSVVFSALIGMVSLTACQANPNMNSHAINKTHSGLGYKVIKQGYGKTIGLDDEVEIRFMSYDSQGRPLDGTMSGTPVILRPSQMFEGLKEGLMLMQVGGVYELYIPAHLGYSDDVRLAKQSATYKVEVIANHS